MARRNSRSLGKLTSEIKVRIDDDTRDELDRLAADAGMDLCHFIRVLVLIRVYGRDHIARLEERRLSVVAGIGRDED
jgi:hypothetical protein